MKKLAFLLLLGSWILTSCHKESNEEVAKVKSPEQECQEYLKNAQIDTFMLLWQSPTKLRSEHAHIGKSGSRYFMLDGVVDGLSFFDPANGSDLQNFNFPLKGGFADDLYYDSDYILLDRSSHGLIEISSKDGTIISNTKFKCINKKLIINGAIYILQSDNSSGQNIQTILHKPLGQVSAWHEIYRTTFPLNSVDCISNFSVFNSNILVIDVAIEPHEARNHVIKAIDLNSNNTLWEKYDTIKDVIFSLINMDDILYYFNGEITSQINPWDGTVYWQNNITHTGILAPQKNSEAFVCVDARVNKIYYINKNTGATIWKINLNNSEAFFYNQLTTQHLYYKEAYIIKAVNINDGTLYRNYIAGNCYNNSNDHFVFLRHFYVDETAAKIFFYTNNNITAAKL